MAATRVRYGFFVALGFGGGIFMLLFAGIFMFELGAAVVLAGFGVLAGGVFAGLFALSFTTAVAQAVAKMLRDAPAISAAIFNLVMKPPLVVSGYRALEKPLLDDFVRL